MNWEKRELSGGVDPPGEKRGQTEVTLSQKGTATTGKKDDVGVRKKIVKGNNGSNSSREKGEEGGKCGVLFGGGRKKRHLTWVWESGGGRLRRRHRSRGQAEKGGGETRSRIPQKEKGTGKKKEAQRTETQNTTTKQGGRVHGKLRQ